ncbi:MAG: GYD domain-containing protein [Acidobacteria bacterium]|nr:GYD domain-containing protein [Acidobacteriota bacterium]
MPKFMVRVSYNADGARGLIKEGGTGRRATVQKVIEDLGGRMETFYFAYGEHDAFVIADFPDSNAGLAVSLAVNASGAVRASTVPLITPEEMDAACKRSVAYKAPGA